MASKKTGARYQVALKCSECGNLIRPTFKNTKNTTDKLEMKKFCPRCNKSTTFVETKIGK